MYLPLASFIPGENMLPILIVVLLLFGAQRLPGLARSMGEGIREFKKSVRETTEEDEPAATTEQNKA